MFKNFFCGLFFLLLFCTTARAQEFKFTGDTVSSCNMAMNQIFIHIVKMKKVYKELNDFDQISTVKNQYGIKTFVYKYADTQSRRPIKYELGLEIIKTADQSAFFNREGYFEKEFPLLGIKLAGFTDPGGRQRFFDLEKYVEDFGQGLWDLEQEYLPYKLILRPEKEVYALNEDITFKVTLKNTGRQMLKFKDLNEQTVFFLYGGRPWGIKRADENAKDIKDFYLKSGETRTTIFKGEGFGVPKEVEIECVYALPYQGVRPSGILKIKVVRE
ncbi:MAG: hypothetical protein HQL26_03305 [Candidatus Omnitrophica bacterium]|nr:hypothetical protein [Candidatus Omnitrophota bacterium]